MTIPTGLLFTFVPHLFGSLMANFTPKSLIIPVVVTDFSFAIHVPSCTTPIFPTSVALFDSDGLVNGTVKSRFFPSDVIKPAVHKL